MTQRQRRQDFYYDDEDLERLPVSHGSPGKSTLTSRLASPPVVIFRVADNTTVRAGDTTGAGSPDLAVEQAKGGTGRPLPTEIRELFEASLGSSLTKVRLHTGPESANAATAVGARAYTIGNDIHFGAGEFCTTDPFALHLLALLTVSLGGAGFTFACIRVFTCDTTRTTAHVLRCFAAVVAAVAADAAAWLRNNTVAVTG